MQVPATCVIGDAAPIMTAGLRAILSIHGVLDTLAVAHDPASLVDLVADLRPDLVLSGFEPLTASLRLVARLDEVPVLALTWSCSREEVAQAVGSGVGGVVLKDASAGQLGAAVAAVLGGATPVPRVIRLAAAHLMPAVRMTARETAVVDLVVQGLTNQQIARRLGIAPQTVKNHVHAAMVKLGARSRVELCLWAQRAAATGA
jgi:DNA-binding NarL/FixJ family response regulator